MSRPSRAAAPTQKSPRIAVFRERPRHHTRAIAHDGANVTFSTEMNHQDGHIAGLSHAQSFTLSNEHIAMKQTLIAIAHDVDAYCARMNNGLAAVAIVLGILVAAAAVFRAEQVMPTLMDNIASDYQLTPES